MNRDSKILLTLQNAGLQALYWMTFCPIYSFASVFLLFRHFSNQQIGWIIALSNILAVFLQPVLGALVDRYARFSLKRVLVILSVVALLLMGGMNLFTLGVTGLAIFYIGAVSLIIAMQPLVTSLTFEYINAGRGISFGLTRAAGSLGFAILSTILGFWVIRTSPAVIPYLSAVLVIWYILLILSFPRVERKRHATAPPAMHQVPAQPAVGFLRRYRRLVPFLLGVACLFTFHTSINAFLAQIMASVGGRTTDLGVSLAIAAICELPAMLGFNWLSAKFSGAALLKFSGIMYALRSFVYLIASSVLLVDLGQVFQAFSFAVFIPASVYYINATMKGGDKVKGQAYLNGMATLGGVIGSVAGGWLLDHNGVPGMLVFASAAAVLGALLLFYAVHNKKPSASVDTEDAAAVLPVD